MISKLHYLTQEIPGKTHLQAVKEACEAGCTWIQLRVKDKPYEEFLDLAYASRKICSKFNARLIINDNVQVCLQVQADGVHLGKKDMNLACARKVLGHDYIIGGTACSFHDVSHLHDSGADYIGLGPFRFTNTKENLAPILGITGYQDIVRKCRQENIEVPLIAIGGITSDDIPDLMKTGIYGIAMSNYLTINENKKEAVQDMMTSLNGEKLELMI